MEPPLSSTWQSLSQYPLQDKVPYPTEIVYLQPKSDKTLRIYSHNIHSLKITRLVEMQQIIYKLQTANADMYLLQ